MTGLQVRYGTFATSVEKQPWRDCLDAEVIDAGALAIKWDADHLEWVPLHVIRGPIQVRKKPEPDPEPVPHVDPHSELGKHLAAPSTPEEPA